MQGHQVFYIEDAKNGTNWRVVQVVQNKWIWDVPEVDDVDNEQLNIVEIVDNEHQVGETVEDDTCTDPTLILQLLKDRFV